MLGTGLKQKENESHHDYFERCWEAHKKQPDFKEQQQARIESMRKSITKKD